MDSDRSCVCSCVSDELSNTSSRSERKHKAPHPEVGVRHAFYDEARVCERQTVRDLALAYASGRLWRDHPEVRLAAVCFRSLPELVFDRQNTLANDV